MKGRVLIDGVDYFITVEGRRVVDIVSEIGKPPSEAVRKRITAAFTKRSSNTVKPEVIRKRWRGD